MKVMFKSEREVVDVLRKKGFGDDSSLSPRKATYKEMKDHVFEYGDGYLDGLYFPKECFDIVGGSLESKPKPYMAESVLSMFLNTSFGTTFEDNLIVLEHAVDMCKSLLRIEKERN